jgi:hypothetical protein
MDFIYVEEEIITVRRGWWSSAGSLEKEWYERKKKIKLNFSLMAKLMLERS